MRSVKEVSEITGVSIRTLRYYDEIGLLKPTQLTEAGYRIYDGRAIEKLQQILFFRELEIPLADIKEIMDNPHYDRKQALRAQHAMLVRKRNRLDGLIELITDVMKGANTMEFEAFNKADADIVFDRMKEKMPKEEFDKLLEAYGGSEEKYRAYMAGSLEENSTKLIQLYGSKEKAMEAVKSPKEDLDAYQKENEEICRAFQQFVGAENPEEEDALVVRLAECYKGMFHLDNARALLLDLAKEYLQNEMMREANDRVFGEGNAKCVALAIQRYYGV